MKRLNINYQKTKSGNNRFMRIWKSGFILLLFMISATGAVSAQNTTWDMPITNLTPGTITKSGDVAKLRFSFVVTGSNVADARVVVTLPSGYTGTAISNGATMASGINSNISSGVNTGTVTIAVNSSGTTLEATKQVDLILDVKASCSAGESGVANISVRSGSTQIGNGGATVNVYSAIPTIQVTMPGTYSGSPRGTTYNMSLSMVTTGMTANSFRLTLTRPSTNTTLSNFKLDGVSLSPQPSLSGNNYTMTFNNINLSTVVKHLTFDAVDIYGGIKNITSSIQYLSGPSGSNCGVSTTGGAINFSYPLIPGTAHLEFVSNQFVAEGALDTYLDWRTEVPMNGTTRCYIRVEYKNTGNAPIAQIAARIRTFRDLGIYNLGIIDNSSNILYSVDGGVTKVPAGTSPTATISYGLYSVADNGYFKLLSAFINKPQEAFITINEPLPGGATLVVYYPVYQGLIYNNEGYMPTADVALYVNRGIQASTSTIISAIDGNGATVATPASNYSHVIQPAFVAAPPTQTFYNGDQNEVTFRVGYGDLRAGAVDLYIQLPNWLELQTSNPAGSISTTGVASQTVSATATTGQYKISLTANGNVSGDLTVKYKVINNACVITGGNVQDSIRYWIDWDLAGNTPLRPTLPKIAQKFQQVILFCDIEGIKMDTFALQRLSVGLIDTNDNSIPDTNTDAPNSDILNDIYLPEDSGKIIIRGVVHGTYNHLYTLLSIEDTDFNTVELKTPQYKKNNGSFTSVSWSTSTDPNTKRSIGIPGPFVANDTITIEIPFTAKAFTNALRNMKAEMYMSSTSVSDPFSPGNAREGQGTLYTPITIQSPDISGYYGDSGANVTFASNSVQNIGLQTFSAFRNTEFVSPYFSNEYRQLAKLKYYDITVPSGYYISPTAPLTIRQTHVRDSHATSNNPIIHTGGCTYTVNSNGTITYRFDLTGTLVDAYEGATYAGLGANQWMYPDDKFEYYFNVGITATKSAPAAGIINVRSTYVPYYNKDTGEEVSFSPVNLNIAYSGSSALLTLGQNPSTLYGKRAKVTVVAENAYNNASNMWLYIEGLNGVNVSNASANNGAGTAQGVTGQWLPLNSVNAWGSKNFELEFDVANIACNNNDQVRIYLVSSFGNSSYTPTTGAPVDPMNAEYLEYLGDVQTLTLRPATAASSIITGSLTMTPDSLLEHHLSVGSKTIIAELSTGGTAAVSNAEMILSVPKGQRLVRAKIEYPKGSAPVTITAPLLTTMQSILGFGSNLNNIREYKFKVNEFASVLGLSEIELLGLSSAKYVNGTQTIRLHLKMESDCESDLMNTYYRASIIGKTLCGDRATNDSTAISEVQVRFPPSAMFELTPSFKSGIEAFNEIKRTDTLSINIRRFFGTGNLSNLDSLTITIPDMVNVLPGGIITASSGDIPAVNGATIAVASNTTSSGLRTIKTILPFTEINTDAVNGFNKNFSINIPIEYTPVSYVISNPVDSIIMEMTTQERLHSSCAYVTFEAGDNQMKFAMLTANYNPYPAYVEEPTIVIIITDGFDGSWYKETVGGTAISTTDTLSFIPKYIPVSGDTTFYVSTIINGNDYGRVPVLVNIDTLPPWRQKDASLLISPVFNHNGTYGNPVSILFSENVKYTVSMVNVSQKAGAVVLRDTLPAYMNYAGNASPSTGFTITTTTGTPTRDVLEWNIPSMIAFDTVTVSYEATPMSGACASQPLFINQAWLYTSDSLLYIRTTNRTYHQGAGISITTFSAQLGGKIYNATEQAVDFRSSPASGIVIVPDEGYRFAGWSHDSYTSLRSEMIEAQEGIMHYDTLTVHGDVELRASFVPIEESIDSEEKEYVVAKAAETEDKVWSVKDELNVRTIKAGSIVRIYTTDGILYEQYTTTTSDVTTRKLPRGIYIVTVNNNVGKKVRIE